MCDLGWAVQRVSCRDEADDLRAERDAYRRLLVRALPILADVQMVRGAVIRRPLIKDIADALAVSR